MPTIVEEFYNAFTKLDANNMVKHYHKDIVFEDPAFGQLKGERAKNMWRMICKSQQNKDFKVEYKVVSSNEQNAKVTWNAFYKFSQTGRSVHNKITATFVIKDNLIIKHTDDFNLHQWSKQALGFKGYLLGNTSFFKKKLQQQTNKLLDTFENSSLKNK